MTILDRLLQAARNLPEVATRHAAELVRELQHPTRRTRAFDAATPGRRMSSWSTTGADANAETLGGNVKMRDRMRDLERNSPHGRAAILNLASMLVGSGLTPQAQTGTTKADKAWQDLFAEWSAQCDPVSRGNFSGVQFLLAMALVRDGEALVRRRWRRLEDALPVPLVLQALEGDFLDSTYDGQEGRYSGRIVGGIEFDLLDRRRAYRMYRAHPGDTYRPTTGAYDSTWVPASEVLHLYGYTTGRPGQVRGVPWLHSVAARLWDYDGAVDAVGLRRRMAASVAGFVTGGDPDAAADGVDGITPAVDGDGVKVLDARGYPVEQFEPGLICYLPPGKEITFPEPLSAPDHETYSRVTLREIAAGAGIPYESFGDLSQASFISARLGRIAVRRLMDALRAQVFVPLLLDPVASWFTEAAVWSGKLPDRKGGYPVRWVPPPWEDADEQKRVAAIVAKIRAGLLTLRQAIVQEGLDPDEVLTELAKQQSDNRASGLVLDSDPSQTTTSGSAQSIQDAPEEAAEPVPPT